MNAALVKADSNYTKINVTQVAVWLPPQYTKMPMETVSVVTPLVLLVMDPQLPIVWLVPKQKSYTITNVLLVVRQENLYPIKLVKIVTPTVQLVRI